MKFYVWMLAACFVLASGVVQASGITLHMFMSDMAIGKVQDSEFKDFLIKHKNTIRNGVIYPDSGYVQSGSYGEFSHWDEFHNGYARYLDQNCTAPLSQKCEKLFAFFLGSLAHALGDVNFDRYFVQELAHREFNGSMSDAQKYTDTGLDFLAILEYGRGTAIPCKWVPKSHLVKIYESLDKNVTRKEISYNTGVIYAALIGERLGSPFTYLYYKFKSDWGPKSYYDQKGGVLDSAEVIAAMWDKIWMRWKRDQRFLNIAKLKSPGSWPNVDFYIED